MVRECLIDLLRCFSVFQCCMCLLLRAILLRPLFLFPTFPTDRQSLGPHLIRTPAKSD